MGIRNIKHKGLKALFLEDDSKIGARYAKNAKAILDYLRNIKNIEDCRNVKNFHSLQGKRKDTYSMHVTGNYCITFRWDGNDVYDINFEDYH